MTTLASEPDLIAQSLAGDPRAFASIVRRHQSLICSLAYAATGNLARSEDISQDVFLAAWKQLPELREPAKLRPWLCGIARNLINNARRQGSRERALFSPTLARQLSAPAASADSPHDRAVSNEEQALLWRALAKIPVRYREPLILFYRREQSIPQIADALALTPDAVKQRLSRGRKLLHAEVLSFVEGALQRSAPGEAFTRGVITALPALASSASGTALGAVAAKGSAAAKAASSLSFLGALFAPLLLLLGYWTHYKMAAENTSSAGELAYVRSLYRRLTLTIVGFFFGSFFLFSFGPAILTAHPRLFTTLVLTLAFTYTAAVFTILIKHFRRRLRTAPQPAAAPAYEYRSPFTFLGFPLIHICIARNGLAHVRPVKAWIAIGEFPIGLLFAFGGCAIAPISIGGIAVGLLSFGGLATGLFSCGGFAIAFGSFGGLALGYQSFGGVALGWHAAVGGIAIARDFAVSYLAQAAHTSNNFAQSTLSTESFFHIARITSRYAFFLNAIWVVPLLFWRRALRKSKVAPPDTPTP